MPSLRSRAALRSVRFLVLLALTLPSACRNANVIVNVYDTTDEARAAGAIAAGYLPDGLPAGTSDIREAHDPDTGRSWALFTFPVDRQDALRALLQPTQLAVDGMEMDVPGRIEWWPLILRKTLDGPQIHATGLEVYRTRDGKATMAVNWAQGRAYYWAP